MEKYYIKLPNGRYQEVGYNVPDMCDGFYFTQRVGAGRRTTLVPYWAGRLQDLDEVLNVQKLVTIMQHDDNLCMFLREHIDAGNLKVFNISLNDFSLDILRFLYHTIIKEEI